MNQPIHTVYGGAHLFHREIVSKVGRIALRALSDYRHYLPFSEEILARVEAKLRREPVEDYRIDFEDGYGYRSDEEEDRHAAAAAVNVAQADVLPRLLGIRIKPLTQRERSLRTLRIFFDNLKQIPEGFVVCLPKVTRPEEVEELARESPSDVEFMLETPQALMRLTEIVEAAGHRCRAVHFGPYDFTASCGVLGTVQGLRHPLCDHARATMLVRLCESSIWLSDGPTNLLPIGSPADIALSLRTQMEDVQHALRTGFYQGWDLHPAQLPMRYATVCAHYREMMPVVKARLQNFRLREQQATRVGAIFDDAATIRGLETFVDRAASCGAVSEDEAVALRT